MQFHAFQKGKNFMLSIVIPVKNPPNITAFIESNRPTLSKSEVIVIDSGSGEALQKLAKIYIREDLKFWKARKLGYAHVSTPHVLNLDCDVVVPEGYVEDALVLLQQNKAEAVSIFYEDVNHCQGALEFGVSIWKTEVLRKLYDFSMDKVMDGRIVKVGSMAYSTLNNGWCECTYMWRKLKNAGGRLETLPYRAKHLKP
jgi:glycosyltransferase involved in cell wall biosynthesis